MKIRRGFVSNSSSSSFIIAFDPADFQEVRMCKECGSRIDRPDNLIEGDSGLETEVCCDRLHYIAEQLEPDSTWSYSVKMVAFIKEQANKGRVVIDADLDYHSGIKERIQALESAGLCVMRNQYD